MNITGGLTVTLGIDEVVSSGLDSGDLNVAESTVLAFLTGTAANQCDRKWSTQSTLAPSASDTWILSALTDLLGRPVVFARVKYLYIESEATVDGDDLTVGGAATHPWTQIGGTFQVKSLGVEVKAGQNTTGFLVVAATSDQLKITNSGANSITYRIVLAGCSV